ncbi:MAG TPA: type II toxin-antitoxin system ParD family antitoxin [Caulobacteraceae bacterium]|nr:type II toxin-antitoxin system ParD family antitoxin [Caulobacteraceae bacterium]
MSKIEKLSIAVTHEQAQTIRQSVQDGEFASASEAVRDALRDWEGKRAARTAAIERIRRLWDEGIASGPAAPARSFEEIKAAASKRMAKRA